MISVNLHPTFERESVASAPAPEVHIRAFQPGDADAFRALNEDWISKYFVLEAPDRQALGDPEGYILRPGGHIFMAFAGDKPVGCCALLASGPGVFELAKMAVAEDCRGRGIGRKLLDHTIEEAKVLGARSLFLASNSKLANAVHLYEACGFRHVPRESLGPYPYARANVFMKLEL